jgi:Flp pilus assembly CpaE family ATPase
VGLILMTGAKGGCGASLTATNLAVALARHAETLLVDLHDGEGVDDLLLDLRPQPSWAELLAVAGELSPRHLDLGTSMHASGLRLLASPPRIGPAGPERRMHDLVAELARRFAWVVVDLPARRWRSFQAPAPQGWMLLVLTADPPALRAAQRWIESFDPPSRARVGLVFNQHTPAHPADPASIAASLGVRLWATLPRDARAVGFQVNFGRACAMDPDSAFGRAAADLARAVAAATIPPMEAT